MSCYVCASHHITALATLAVRVACEVNGIAITDSDAVRDEAQWVALALHTENVASFTHRYEGRHLDEVGPFEFCEATFLATLTSDAIDWAQVNMGARCYDYQACEHPAYSGSLAQSIAADLTALADSHLYRETPNHAAREARVDAAVWGWPEPEPPAVAQPAIAMTAEFIRAALRSAAKAAA